MVPSVSFFNEQAIHVNSRSEVVVYTLSCVFILTLLRTCYKFAESFNHYVRAKNKRRRKKYKIIGALVFPTNYKSRDYSPRINGTYVLHCYKVAKHSWLLLSFMRLNTRSCVVWKNSESGIWRKQLLTIASMY